MAIKKNNPGCNASPTCACGGVLTCYTWPLDCPTDSDKPWTEGDCGSIAAQDRFSEITFGGVTAGTGTTTIGGVPIATWLNDLFRLEKLSNAFPSLRYLETVTVVHNGVSSDLPMQIDLTFDDGAGGSHNATWTCKFGTPGSEEIGTVVFTLANCDHDQIVKTGAVPGVALTLGAVTNGWANFSAATADGFYGASIFDYSDPALVSGNLRWGWPFDGFGFKGDPAAGMVTKKLPDPIADAADSRLVPTNPVIKIPSLQFTDTGQYLKIRYGESATNCVELVIETIGDLACDYDSGEGRCIRDAGADYAVHVKLHAIGTGGSGTDEFTTDPTTAANQAFLDALCSGVAAPDCSDYAGHKTLTVSGICFSHLAREGKAFAMVGNLGGFTTGIGAAGAEFEIAANPGKFIQFEVSAGVTVDPPTVNTAGQQRWFLHPSGGTPKFMDATLNMFPDRFIAGSLVSSSSTSDGVISISLSNIGTPTTGDRVMITWDGSTGATPGTRWNCLLTDLGGGSFSIADGFGDDLPTAGFLPIDMPNAGDATNLGAIEWKETDRVWIDGDTPRNYLTAGYHLTQDPDPARLCHWIGTQPITVTPGGIGTLKSEASSTDGVITWTAGAMPADNDTIDIAWRDGIFSGKRTGVLAHPIAGSDITISGGTGDALPDARYTDTVSGQGAPMMFMVEGAATAAAEIDVTAIADNTAAAIDPSPLLPPSGDDPDCDTGHAHQIFNETDSVSVEFALLYVPSGTSFGDVVFSRDLTTAAYTEHDLPCNSFFESSFAGTLPGSWSTTDVDFKYALLTMAEPDDSIADNPALHFHPRCSKCSHRLVDSVDAVPLADATPADSDGRCNACKDCQFTGITYEELLVTGYAAKVYENGSATSGGESCAAGVDDDLGCPHLSSVNGTYPAWRNDPTDPLTTACADCQRCAWRGPTTYVSDGMTDCPHGGLGCVPVGGEGTCIYGSKNIFQPTGCDPPGDDGPCSDVARTANVYPFCPSFEDSCDTAGDAGRPPSDDWAQENEWCESGILVEWYAWTFFKKWRDITNPRTGRKFDENDPPPRFSDLDGLEIPGVATNAGVDIEMTCCGEGTQTTDPVAAPCTPSGFVGSPYCPYCWRMKMIAPDHVTLNLGRRHVT